MISLLLTMDTTIRATNTKKEAEAEQGQLTRHSTSDMNRDNTPVLLVEDNQTNQLVALGILDHLGDREKHLTADMDEYISKPVSAEMLANAFESWFPLVSREKRRSTSCQKWENSLESFYDNVRIPLKIL